MTRPLTLVQARGLHKAPERCSARATISLCKKQNWNVGVARERDKVASAQVAPQHAAAHQLDVSAKLHKAMNKKHKPVRSMGNDCTVVPALQRQSDVVDVSQDVKMSRFQQSHLQSSVVITTLQDVLHSMDIHQNMRYVGSPPCGFP